MMKRIAWSVALFLIAACSGLTNRPNADTRARPVAAETSVEPRTTHEAYGSVASQDATIAPIDVTVDYSKLDTNLSMEVRNWLEEPNRHPQEGISVDLDFFGDITVIEALGFELDSVWKKGSGEVLSYASGVVQYKDVAALTAHPAVRWISVGDERYPW